MDTEKIIQKLINGETVFIQTNEHRKEIQARLREIKKNCTICLTQLKEQL